MEADLRRPETLNDALRGVRAVVATANAVAPVHRGNTEDGLAEGYAELIARARAAGVERFVYASVPETPLDATVPTVRVKRAVERLLADSGMSYASVRSRPVEVGGPEVLSWTDVARVFGEVLGRPVRVRTVPVAVFSAGQRALARVAPSAAGVLALNRLIGTAETPWDTAELTRRLGVHPLRTVEQVLREKAALPAG